MPISILNYPVHLQEGLKLNRECVKSQGSQNEDRKVFHRDSLEVSKLSKNREIITDKIKHTVMQSATSFRDMRAGILLLPIFSDFRLLWLPVTELPDIMTLS